MRKILDVIKENEAIACKTHEEAKEYCKLSYEQGLKLGDGWDSCKYPNNWHIYESNTVYLPHRCQYGHYKRQPSGVVIISFEEFKERLKETNMRKILDVIKGNEGIHCRTIEQAKEYCNIANEQGLAWCTGESYNGCTKWEEYECATVYFPIKGIIGSVTTQHPYMDYISFEEFKERLKENKSMKRILDVVKAKVGIYCSTLDESVEYSKIAREQGLSHTQWQYISNETVYYPHEGLIRCSGKIESETDVISFKELNSRLTESSEIKEETNMSKTEAKQASNVDYDARRYELVKMIMGHLLMSPNSNISLGKGFANKVFETADYIVEQLKQKENE